MIIRCLTMTNRSHLYLLKWAAVCTGLPQDTIDSAYVYKTFSLRE
jgi:hypothetical protein